MEHSVPFSSNCRKSKRRFWTAKRTKHTFSYCMTYFFEIFASFWEIGWVLMQSTISVWLWHKTCGEPRTYVSGTFEREIREKRRFVHQNTRKKTLPAGLARHCWGKKCQSLLKILLPIPKFPTLQNAPFYRIFVHESILNSNPLRILHSGASPLETHP